MAGTLHPRITRWFTVGRSPSVAVTRDAVVPGMPNQNQNQQGQKQDQRKEIQEQERQPQRQRQNQGEREDRDQKKEREDSAITETHEVE